MLRLIAELGLDGWEEWSYFATIVAVLVNGVFLYFLIRQVKLGQEAQKASERAADAAQNSVKEAMYARIDQQAPRVIAILDNPLLGGIQSPNEIVWKASHEAVFPRDKEKLMYVGVTGTLINEGKGTARVCMNGFANLILNDDDEPFLIGPLPATDSEHILRPGDQVRFQWADMHSLDDWVDAYSNSSPANPRGACFLEITVHDYFQEGVIDHIFLEMSGRPLVPKEGDDGHWIVPDKPEFVARSYPIVRAHIREDNYKIIPPWEKTYSEWAKLHGI